MPGSLPLLLGVLVVVVSRECVQCRVQFVKDEEAPRTEQVRADSTGREVTNFDFAWRFHLGEVDGNETCAFPRNLTGTQCLGLYYVGAASTIQECVSACCEEDGCHIWQWANPQSDPSKGCWIGASDQCSANAAWQSGGRNASVNPPPATSGPTSRGYDDSGWELIDVPHDGIIGGAYSPSAQRSHGYLPFNRTWYRKHFNLPAEWKTGRSSIWLYFEGVFHMTTVYLNGEFALPLHRGGYTSFSVRLDNVSALLYGDGKANENVVAVTASASGGSGWWYEGGGIYRHTYLVHTPDSVHVVTHGVNPSSNVTGDITWHSASNPAAGQVTTVATVTPVVEIVNDAATADAGKYAVKVSVSDESGAAVQSSTATTTAPLPPMTGVKVTLPTMTMSNSELWSAQRPYLYSLTVEVTNAAGDVIDNVTMSFGLRRATWTPDAGFFLNDQPYKWRGFCDHNDFAGLGVAVPERVNLFRAQSMKAVGGNSWRMSHNPPVPALLDILDRVGVVVWDENRDFFNTSYDIDNQRSMVKRDRHHPSVMCWSFCNEAGCESQNAAVGAIFGAVSKEEDATRPVTGNTFDYGPGKLSEVLDVQGFSHRGGNVFDNFHRDHPDRSVIGSECCSCTTQRGEDVANGGEKILANFNGACLQGQTGVEMSRKFVSGLLVWTLFDYYGEPAFAWPHRSSSFGAIDLAGFAKAGAFYYRAWWLHSPVNMSASVADLPHRPIPLRHHHHGDVMNTESRDLAGGNEGKYIIHIAQHWQSYVGGNSRLVQAHTNAPHAELFLNGQTQGIVDVPWIGFAQWTLTFQPGNLTAVGRDAGGNAIAVHTVLTPGDAMNLSLSVDAPSESTGTGDALLLDGFDTAMVRASILDSNGRVVPGSAHNVTFTVLSGPGRVVAVGSGDPQCHEPNQATWRSAYHGLVRAFVRVTEHRSGDGSARDRMLRIDAEGNRRTRVLASGTERRGVDDAIVVQASAVIDGKVVMDAVAIPASPDEERHGVLQTAHRWMRAM